MREMTRARYWAAIVVVLLCVGVVYWALLGAQAARDWIRAADRFTLGCLVGGLVVWIASGMISRAIRFAGTSPLLIQLYQVRRPLYEEMLAKRADIDQLLAFKERLVLAGSSTVIKELQNFSDSPSADHLERLMLAMRRDLGLHDLGFSKERIFSAHLEPSNERTLIVSHSPRGEPLNAD